MKKINYILIALVAGFGLSSCYDDDPINEYPVQGLSDINLSVSSVNAVTSEGFVVPFTATIPQTYTEDVTVEAQLKVENGDVRNTITIPAGQTSASGTITMLGDDVATDFNGRDILLTMSGFSLDDNAVAGQPAAFNVTSNEVSLTSYDAVQFAYGAGVVADRATVLLDWENPAANDLDMRIFDTDFNLVESAGTGSRYETDILNDTHPDGDYFVVVDVYSATAPLPWQLFFVFPDQETVSFTGGTLSTDDVAAGIVFPVFEYTKSTDGDGNSVYTIGAPSTKAFTEAQIAKINSQKIDK